MILFFLFPGIGAWYQQRAGIKVAGEDPDTHDDFKPVERDAESAPSVHETIQKVWLIYVVKIFINLYVYF